MNSDHSYYGEDRLALDRMGKDFVCKLMGRKYRVFL